MNLQPNTANFKARRHTSVSHNSFLSHSLSFSISQPSRLQSEECDFHSYRILYLQLIENYRAYFFFNSKNLPQKLNKKVYDNECLSGTRIFEYFKRFKERPTKTEDARRLGQLSMATTDENIPKNRYFYP